MAGNICFTTTPAVSIVATVVKTPLQIQAPTNQSVKVLGWGVYFDGISATAKPIDVRVLRQTSAGTASTGTSKTLNGRAESILSTSRHTFTAEPTNASEELDRVAVHPQGWYEVRFPAGQEIIIPGAGYLGIECSSASAAPTVNVRAKFIFEE